MNVNNYDELLIKEYERYIYKIASSSTFKHLEREDVIQAGWKGLLMALKKYRNDLGAKASTYAQYDIFGEMYKLSLGNNPLKIQKDVYRICKLTNQVRQKLYQETGIMPSYTEISLYLKVPEEVIYFAETATMSTISIDTPVDEEEKSSLHEIIADQTHTSVDDTIDLHTSMGKLPEIEQKILNLRYMEDRTQSETAKILGINQAKVSRYENKSLEKMRGYIAA